MQTRIVLSESQRDAVMALAPRRNSALRGAFARGRVVDVRVAEDATLLAIDADGWARLSDPSSEEGAVALARSPLGQSLFTRLRGPVRAADAFVAARTDASSWSRVVENFEMVLAEAPASRASHPAGGTFRSALEVDGPFDAWREAFTRECFPEGMKPPPVARDQLFVWIDGAARSMAGLLPIGDDAMRIVTVYTPPSDRGRGYAGALVTAMGEHARGLGARVLSLDVDVTNTAAQRAYERAGFRTVGHGAIFQASGLRPQASGREEKRSPLTKDQD